MTLFLIVAALFTAAALMFVLPTLLRKELGSQRQVQSDDINLSVLRDQLRELDADLASGNINSAGYDSARHELERRVAEDVQPAAAQVEAKAHQPWVAVVIGLTIPATAISLYFLLGSPNGINADNANKPAASQNQEHAVTAEQIAAMVSGLEQKLKNRPDDADGWYMLARSYHAMNRYRESADAYAKLVKLIPDNADVLSDYADTLALAQNRSLQGEPEQIIARALAADPNHIKALALAGSAAFDRRDFKTAVIQWKKILSLVPQDSETARSTMGNIGEAQSLINDGATMSAPMPRPPAMSDSGAPSAPTVASKNSGAVKVTGVVELDAALRAKVADTDSVFIFARAAQGPKFPLAVIRKQVKDLPFQFVLDDSMSMMPNVKMSDFPMLIVGARISKSGNAIPSAGDFEGVIESVQPGTTGLTVRIATERK